VELFISVLVSGVAIGLIYGILGFSTVFLYKTTGVINFAAGNMGMFGAFVVYRLYTGPVTQWWLAVLGGLVGAALLGALLYVVTIRPREDAGSLNLLARTVAIYLLLFAVVDKYWGDGQPFDFRSSLPSGGGTAAGIYISWSDVGTALICLVLAVVGSILMLRTPTGLQFLALADNPRAARLLGLRVNRLAMIAWALVGLIGILAAMVIAPRQLLSSRMMEPVLLNAFAGVIIGGIKSLGGAFAGGIIIGVATNIVATYLGSDLAVVASFVVLISFLLVRPHGIFGTAQVRRV
jgi:branched-chain amino acid transport system permease protein